MKTLTLCLLSLSCLVAAACGTQTYRDLGQPTPQSAYMIPQPNVHAPAGQESFLNLYQAALGDDSDPRKMDSLIRFYYGRTLVSDPQYIQFRPGETRALPQNAPEDAKRDAFYTFHLTLNENGTYEAMVEISAHLGSEKSWNRVTGKWSIEERYITFSDAARGQTLPDLMMSGRIAPAADGSPAVFLKFARDAVTAVDVHLLPLSGKMLIVK